MSDSASAIRDRRTLWHYGQWAGWHASKTSQQHVSHNHCLEPYFYILTLPFVLPSVLPSVILLVIVFQIYCWKSIYMKNIFRLCLASLSPLFSWKQKNIIWSKSGQWNLRKRELPWSGKIILRRPAGQTGISSGDQRRVKRTDLGAEKRRRFPALLENTNVWNTIVLLLRKWWKTTAVPVLGWQHQCERTDCLNDWRGVNNAPKNKWTQWNAIIHPLQWIEFSRSW